MYVVCSVIQSATLLVTYLIYTIAFSEVL